MTALDEYQKYAEEQYVLGVVADAAIESLKCCANCNHIHDAAYLDGPPRCDEYEYMGQVDYHGHCMFTSSRWKERRHA